MDFYAEITIVTVLLYTTINWSKPSRTETGRSRTPSDTVTPDKDLCDDIKGISTLDYIIEMSD